MQKQCNPCIVYDTAKYARHYRNSRSCVPVMISVLSLQMCVRIFQHSTIYDFSSYSSFVQTICDTMSIQVVKAALLKYGL